MTPTAAQVERAREWEDSIDHNWFEFKSDREDCIGHVAALIAAVQAETREECAKVCEAFAADWESRGRKAMALKEYATEDRCFTRASAAEVCENAIRALK